MNNYRQKLGKHGELFSQDYLQKHGYKIIQNNYRTKVGEIDIIAEDNQVLVFVEVKTRRGKNFRAIENVTRKKQLKIAQVADIFLIENDYSNKDIRFDVVTVDNGKIELFKNAFIV